MSPRMDPTRVREPCRDHNTLCGTRTAQLYPLKAGFHYTTTLRFTLHGSFTRHPRPVIAPIRLLQGHSLIYCTQY